MGCSVFSQLASRVWKYALCDGASRDRSAAMRPATFGHPAGSYQTCGLAPVFLPRNDPTEKTILPGRGDAPSSLSTQVSYPSPFLMTSWARDTVSAVPALASNSCGSVFGLVSRLVTVTYLPPIVRAIEPY